MRETRRFALRAAAVALLFLVPFLLPLPEGLKRLRWLTIPGDLMHVPLLGFVTWALQRRGPLRGRPLGAAAAATALGLGIELLQSLTGREASLGDLALDASGALAVACWLRMRAAAPPSAAGSPAAPPVAPSGAARRGARAAHAWLVGAVLALLPAVAHLAALPPILAADALARRRFPLLGDFESSAELGGWYRSHEGRIAIVPREGGGHALRISGSPPHRYPGAYLKGFPRDWTARPRIAFDARCVGADSVRFIVRTDDFAARHDEAWLANRFTARPQWQSFAWTPGASLGRRPSRPQDRRDMDSITIYIARPGGPVAVEIDNLRLE